MIHQHRRGLALTLIQQVLGPHVVARFICASAGPRCSARGGPTYRASKGGCPRFPPASTTPTLLSFSQRRRLPSPSCKRRSQRPSDDGKVEDAPGWLCCLANKANPSGQFSSLLGPLALALRDSRQAEVGTWNHARDHPLYLERSALGAGAPSASRTLCWTSKLCH